MNIKEFNIHYYTNTKQRTNQIIMLNYLNFQEHKNILACIPSID